MPVQPDTHTAVPSGSTVSGTAPPPLERFDPHRGVGRLIDSEHRGRYWWAAGAVEGKDVLDVGCGLGYGAEILAAAGAAAVTAIDIDEPAITSARERLPALADSFLCADLCGLELPDDSFDIVVCFETIQQVADGERALDELHRVLRPGGLLLISLPSPDRTDGYPSGNHQHPRHEYRLTDLSAVVEERFANVDLYRQHPWLASSIEPLRSASDLVRHRAVRATAELRADMETRLILVASDAELPDLGDLLTISGDFEVRRWAEQIEFAGEGAGSNGNGHTAGDDLRQRLAIAEARRSAAEESLRETSEALLEANQTLAKIPALQHRYDELEYLRAYVKILEGSRSWRYMSPARRVRSWFRRTW